MQHTGARRLCALIDGLPPDSALHRTAWSLELELAALRLERHEFWSQQLIGMWAAKGSRLPPAIQISHPDRPAQAPEARKQLVTDTAQIAAFFAGHARR